MPEEIDQSVQNNPSELNCISTEESHKSVSKFRRGVESAILFAEVTPINEAMRVAVGGAAIAVGADPIEVAAVYGSATLAIEGAASFASASWLVTERSKKTVDWFNGKLEQRGISSDAKFNKITKAGIAFLGGSAITNTVHFRENPELQEKEVRNYGYKISAMLAGVCAVQGYAVANGIETPSLISVGGALAAVGSIFGLAGWTKRRVLQEEKAQGIEINSKRRK